MKTTFALAACAALSIGFAACGDDDDDAEGTTAVTSPDVAVTAEAPDTASPGGGAGTTGTAGDTGEVTATEPATEGSEAAIEVSEEQAADCDAFTELLSSLPTIDQPAVGDELSDDFKDAVREAIEGLEGLDLQSEEGDAARDSFIEDFNTLVDADTMTEELQASGSSDEVAAFDEICIANAGT